MSSKLLGGRNIRWKLWAAFMAAAAFIALFVAIILWAHMESVEDASKIEASHVAELIGDLATGKDGFEPELLKTVEQLYSSKDRDFVIVDANRKGLADKDRTGLGHRYDDDRGNEVEQTLADGKVRSFVERSSHHPDGARQVVVPVRSGPRIIGAVLVEYSPTRKKLIRAGVDEFLLIGFLGSSMVLFVLWSGWSVARQIAGPIESLTHGVSRIAERDFAIRITIVSDDELGKLGNGFNQMAAALASHRGELLALNESLDRKVVERTRELRDASLASAKANQELHYLSCYDPLTGLANKSLFVERVQNLCAIWPRRRPRRWQRCDFTVPTCRGGAEARKNEWFPLLLLYPDLVRKGRRKALTGKQAAPGLGAR